MLPLVDEAVLPAVDVVSPGVVLPELSEGRWVSSAVSPVALPEFSPAAGGVSLYRDGFHLSFPYGRFAAACVWLRRLCLTELSRVTFVPEGADARLIKGILRYIDAFFEDLP